MIRSMYRPMLALAAAATAAPAFAAAFVVTAEAPKVENSTSTFQYVGVETFNSIANTGQQNLTTSFGGSPITGTYTNVQINNADQYGGAGGTGKYAVTFSTAGYSLALTSTNANGVNYFGYYLTALDAGNQLTFYKNGNLVYTFSAADALAGLSSAYNGNPDQSGANGSQPYAFLNFYDTNGTFDQVVFQENPQGGGYESDNHTVGYYSTMSGTLISGVPEPTTWAMLIIGFGAIGFALRKAGKRNDGVHKIG